ncbi:MAG: DUF697 domain-containing protein [Desulfobacteraceae bacterium]|nr:DUF697 domain-containing protein [Desulfobacteraceae bacterium]MCP4349200.1 DUF697 domain-containing protein [Desulfobacterales bacterium]
MKETKEFDVLLLKEKGSNVIRNHLLVSIGAGFIPIPIWDLVGIAGVQMNMLRKLSKIYEVPFSDHKVKSILSSLVGGGISIPVGGAIASFAKFIPVIGTGIGAVSLPICAGAVTYAVGKVFLQHFASGGTFLTFDPEKVSDYYAEMLKEGKTVASGVK